MWYSIDLFLLIDLASIFYLRWNAIFVDDFNRICVDGLYLASDQMVRATQLLGQLVEVNGTASSLGSQVPRRVEFELTHPT